MTPFVLRHHDVFRFPSLVTCFSKIVIQNGGKNAVWERRETGQWHRVKNLWFWWQAYGFPHRGSRSFIFVQDDALPAFLTTTADSSHLLRMTPCECIAIRHWLAANSDWLSEFDKSTAHTEQLFLICFCKDDRQGEDHKYRYCPLHNPDDTKRYTRRERYSRRAVINRYFAGDSVFDY